MEAFHRPSVIAPGREPCLDAVQAHQARDPVLAHCYAATLQLAIHARAAVGAAAVLVYALDLRLEQIVALHPSARRALAPRVIACPCYPVYAAHH